MNSRCDECNVIITSRQFLKCSRCQFTYHLDCANVSVARFYLMEPDRKLTWKCSQCLIKPQEIHMDQPPYQHIQLRLSPPLPNQSNRVAPHNISINIPTENSFASLSTDDEDSDNNEESVISLENTSIILNSRYIDPKRKLPKTTKDMENIVKELRDKLNSAEKEIENLLAENKRLKSQMNKSMYNSTPKTAKTPKKNYNKTKLDFLSDTIISVKHNSSQNNDKQAIIDPPVPTDTNESSHTCHTENIDPAPSSEDKSHITPSDSAETSKIYIISNGSNYNLLNIANDTLTQPFFPNHPPKICHYSSPGGGIEQLFSGLENKLENFTQKDYCVVLISENDFLTSERYSTKIELIRNCVQQLQHTNVIICLPTFKLGNYVNIFNKRIGIFNTLLCRDNLKHEYAFIIDSNKNLKYTYEMFNTTSGTANKDAIKTIFTDIKNLISDIIYYSDDTNNTISTSNTFFRP